jgi:adenosylcobinamide kinase / adenosylcobinamide-phosphate guanylyltransferase
MSDSKLVLIGGGARSGKSAYAVQRALSLGPRRIFVATAEAFDDEMRSRIRAHVAERGEHFRTIEAPRELEQATFPVLLVTNEVGFGLVPETALGRQFRDLSGRAHQRLARSAGEVLLAALGCMLRIKPSPVRLAEAPWA